MSEGTREVFDALRTLDHHRIRVDELQQGDEIVFYVGPDWESRCQNDTGYTSANVVEVGSAQGSIEPARWWRVVTDLDLGGKPHPRAAFECSPRHTVYRAEATRV